MPFEEEARGGVVIAFKTAFSRRRRYLSGASLLHSSTAPMIIIYSNTAIRRRRRYLSGASLLRSSTVPMLIIDSAVVLS